MELGRHVLSSDYTLKNFALWSHKCPHVQSLCVCIYTCKHKLNLKSKYYGESVVQTPAKIFIQNCFIAHWCVCMGVYVYIHTHIYTYVLYKSVHWFRTKKIDVNEKLSPWKTILNGILLFYKSKVWDFFPFNLFILISECFQFLFPSFKTLKIVIQMGELGFFVTWN